MKGKGKRQFWITTPQLAALGVITLSLAALAFFLGLMVGRGQAVPADRDTEIRVDPIMQFEKFMAERLKISDETISASKQTAAEIIDTAVEYALKSEDPPPGVMYEDVLA